MPSKAYRASLVDNNLGVQEVGVSSATLIQYGDVSASWKTFVTVADIYSMQKSP